MARQLECGCEVAPGEIALCVWHFMAQPCTFCGERIGKAGHPTVHHCADCHLHAHAHSASLGNHHSPYGEVLHRMILTGGYIHTHGHCHGHEAPALDRDSDPVCDGCWDERLR